MFIRHPPIVRKDVVVIVKTFVVVEPTDLVRYTRINKSFGCGVTKAIKQSRTASEQIARNRANVDCIKPKHRTIFMTISMQVVIYHLMVVVEINV